MDVIASLGLRIHIQLTASYHCACVADPQIIPKCLVIIDHT